MYNIYKFQENERTFLSSLHFHFFTFTFTTNEINVNFIK